MERITVYSKLGDVKYEAYDIEYNDNWMNEEFVNVTVTSPYPINIEVGDYLIYRGLTYTIYSLPTALKQARRDSYGEAFKYENVKFSSRSTELADIRFLDIVLYDNNIHYTSLPTWSLYCETVDDYVDRLQANTDRSGETPWLFITPNFDRTVQRYYDDPVRRAMAITVWESTYGRDHQSPVCALSNEKKDVNVSIDKMSVSDGLSKIKNDFGINFVTKDRICIIGAVGKLTEHIFKYGKGNGLSEIERTADQDQQIVTKLFAYGSDENLPVRYYANLNLQVFADVTEINIMPVYGSINYRKLGLFLDMDFRTANFTDESQFYPGTYIVRIKANDVTIKGYVSRNSENDDRLHFYSEVVNTQPDDRDEPSTSAFDAFAAAIATGDRVYFVGGVDKDTFTPDHKDYSTDNLPNNMAVNVLMLPGFPNDALSDICRSSVVTDVTGTKTVFEIRKDTTSEWTVLMEVEGDRRVTFSSEKLAPYIISRNAENIGIKEGDIHFTEDNDDNGLKKVFPSIEGMTAGDVFGTQSTDRLDEILSCDIIMDNGVFAEGETVKNFNITLKNLGFDLRDAFNNAGGSMVISMKDGYCGGRDFNVKSVTQNDNGTWTLNVERCQDTSLDLWFPYSYNASIGGTPQENEAYQIRRGDHFVLTGIDISDSSYVWAASVKMLRKSIAWLLANDYTRFTYHPKVDELFMAREHETAIQGTSLHDTLKAGDLMIFEDSDFDVSGSVYIDTLVIKEDGNNGIPTYEITLRNDRQVGTLQRLQGQVNTLTNIMGGYTGGLSVSQIRNILKTYGVEWFVSKLYDDIAEGLIGFRKGFWVGVKGLFGMDGNGDTRANNLSADGDVNIGGRLTVKTSKQNVIESSNYNGDGISDTGWRITNDHNGHSKLTIDELYVRMKAVFESLEIKKELVSGGNHVQSCAASTISKVDYLNESFQPLGYSEEKVPFTAKGFIMMLSKLQNPFKILSRTKTIRMQLSATQRAAIRYVRCYFLAEEGDRKVQNWWQSHDLARCQTFNLSADSVSDRGEYYGPSNTKQGNIFWWRKLAGISSTPVEIEGKMYHYFDVYCNPTAEATTPYNYSGAMQGSDIPAVGDEVSQWGNDSNIDRMNLIVHEVNGQDAAVKMYEGVNQFSMESGLYGNPLKIRFAPKTGCKVHTTKWEVVTESFVAPIPVECGNWLDITPDSQGRRIARYYEIYQHNGSSWKCVASTGNEYTVYEDIYVNGVLVYEAGGDPISQADYDALSVDNQMKCTRTSTGSTYDEPSTSSAAWSLYAAKGNKGNEGNGVETVYVRTTDNHAPVIADNDDPFGVDSNGNGPLDDSYLPLVYSQTEGVEKSQVYLDSMRSVLGDEYGECTASALGVNATYRFEWEIKRTKGSPNAITGVRVWNAYDGDMALHNSYADVWTIGQDGYWYKNGVKQSTKAEGKDGNGVELKGTVDVMYNADKTSQSQTSLEGLTMTSANIGECYVVDANRHIYFYNGDNVSFPGNWNDLGLFRGEPGQNAYLHIAYADSITIDGNGDVVAQSGFSVNKQKESYNWVGLCADHTEQDPGAGASTEAEKLAAAQQYEWNYQKGSDGWTVTVNPSPIIISQDMDNRSDFGLPIAIAITAKNGVNNATVGTPTNISNNMGLTVSATGAGALSITAYNKVNDQWVTKGTIIFNVQLTYDSYTVTVPVSISVAANLQGDIKTSVAGAVETTVAQTLSYSIYGDRVHTITQVGEYIRSDHENISMLTKKVDNGKNLLNGVLLGTYWKSTSATTLNAVRHDITVNNGVFTRATGDSYIMSPAFAIEANKYYTASFVGGGNYTFTIVADNGTSTGISIASQGGGGGGKLSFSFRSATAYSAVYVFFGVASLQQPQVEEGSTATDFEADTTELSSQIRQTAENIELSVNDGLQRTGIDIENGQIKLDADKVTVSGNLRSASVGTLGTSGNKIEIDDSTFKVYNSAGIVGLEIGWDSEGNPFLVLRDRTGRDGYKLTYSSIGNASANFTNDEFSAMKLYQLVNGRTYDNLEISEFFDARRDPSEPLIDPNYYMYSAAKNLSTDVYKIDDYDYDGSHREYTDGKTFDTNDLSDVLGAFPDNYMIPDGYYINDMITGDNHQGRFGPVYQKNLYQAVQGVLSVVGSICFIGVYDDREEEWNYYFTRDIEGAGTRTTIFVASDYLF